MNLWLTEEPFPGAGTFGGTAPPSAIQVAGGIELSAVGEFRLTQYSATGTPTVEFDELRIGTSYADVTPVPEPGTVLALVALAGALALRR